MVTHLKAISVDYREYITAKARAKHQPAIAGMKGGGGMVGGIVIGLTRKAEETHVNVADCPHYPKHERGKCPRPDTCCVYTDEINQNTMLKVEVAIGDSFWWQAGRCYWTPQANRKLPNGRGGVDYDIPLKKIGYSH